MNLIKSIAELEQYISALKAENKTIGFVPTMGALHDGHLQLVRRAVAENDVAVVSVFVNPTQFNDKNDLAKYPRTLEADAALLESVGCAAVFAPVAEEFYTEEELNTTFQFDFAGLDEVMEGKFRPGHFNGVVQVVSKLFRLVKPNRAYFGEKDFQQLAIIRHMVRSMQFDIEIVGCPIVREESGLARSSRNTLLSEEQRA
jgi:pantoate--beta-alanine ligase